MAASLSFEQKKEEFKDEFLTCLICAESYDDGKHKAKCLPCLHTYCQACLQSIEVTDVKKRSMLECPKCRKLITVPEGTVNSLPNNFIVDNLKEYQDIFNLSVSCGGCESLEAAVNFCHDCGLFLCQNCIDCHKLYGPLRNHKLSTLNELQDKKNIPMSKHQQHCTTHPNQEVTMYCDEANCKVPVCATCGLLDHRSHDLIELSSAMESIIDDMLQSTARVQDRNKELACKRAAAEILQERLTTNFVTKEKEIQESVEKLHNEIDAAYNEAQSHLKHMYETKMNTLTENIDSIDLLSTQMTSAAEFANKSCDFGNPNQLLNLQNQIMVRLTELEKEKLPETSPDMPDFNLTDKHYAAIVQIQESLKDLYYRPAADRKPRVDPKRSTFKIWLPSANEINEGWGLKVMLQTVDENGHEMTTGGDKVDVIQGTSSPIKVNDNGDGTYLFHNFMYRVGKIVSVKINGCEIKLPMLVMPSQW